MIMMNTKKAIATGSPERIDEYIFQMVRDLENTRWKYHGYSYVRTMRNILIGKSDAAIAPLFSNKEYYGIYEELTLNQLESIMDIFVETGQLECVFTEHGKLYCTKQYYDSYCAK